jgi:hypothetical protein
MRAKITADFSRKDVVPAIHPCRQAAIRGPGQVHGAQALAAPAQSPSPRAALARYRSGVIGERARTCRRGGRVKQHFAAVRQSILRIGGLSRQTTSAI